LFFSLWPDQQVRSQIADNLQRFDLDKKQNRITGRDNLHMTLHFVGNTSFSEMNCLNQQAKLTRGQAFDLVLDCSGYFRKPRVLWFGCQNPPRALYDLQLKLGRSLDICAYTPESRPYSPHVTVARKIASAPAAIKLEPVNWHVDRFVLVKSISIAGGVRYEVVQSYALGD